MVIEKKLRFGSNYKRVLAVWTIKTAIKKFFRRFSGGRDKTRTEEVVNQTYHEVWSTGLVKSTRVESKPSLHTLNGQLILCRDIDRRKFVVEQFSDMLNSLRPKSLLEMGSGNGFNIFALAVMNPEIKSWEGLELTEGGVRASQNFFNNPESDQPILEALVYVTGKNKPEIINAIKAAQIKFVQGDMTKLPYPDRSFECVITKQAIEQIPRNYMKAFTEGARVTSKNAIFLEGFKEGQKNIFQRLYQKNTDYFRYSYKVAEEAGLRILKFEPLLLDKVFYSNSFLTCERVNQ